MRSSFARYLMIKCFVVPAKSCFKVYEGLDFTSNTVVHAPSVIDIDETITSPLICLQFHRECQRFHRYHLPQDISNRNSRCYRLGTVAQDVGLIFASEADYVSRILPVHFLQRHINFTNKFATLPIIEQYRRVSTLITNMMSTK